MNEQQAPSPFEGFRRDLLVQNGFDPASCSDEIGAGDEMFYKAVLPGYDGNVELSKFKYMQSALRTFDIYRGLAGAVGGFGALESVLDFGSGWGRLTRLLVQHVARERIWVADVYHDAVAWQVDRFGVNGLVSAAEPDRFALPLTFSIVLAGSVFSHLPARLFHRWLARLHRLLAPNGVLAFSVHSELMVGAGNAMDASGFHFQSWSESGSLGADVYGMAYVTEGFVAEAIAACAPWRRVGYRRFEKALYENQDLYVVGGEAVDLSGLALPITPMSGVDGAAFGSDVVTVDGWGIDLNAGCQLERAELRAGDALLATMIPVLGNAHVSAYFPEAPNPPVAWSFGVPRGLVPADTALRATLTSRSGAMTHAYVAAPDGAGVVRHT